MDGAQSPDFQSAIRAAVVSEVTEHGISALSMGGIAARAKVPVSRLYLHFDTVDELLQRVYVELRAELHARLVKAKSAWGSAAMIRQMWFELFAFVAERPDDFLFIEYAGARRSRQPGDERQLARMREEINGMLQRGIDDGTLAPLPVSTLYTLLAAPAHHEARVAVQSGKRVSDLTVTQLFERVWLSISARG